MSKPAPRQSSVIKNIWRLINLILLTFGFLTPVVQDQHFGIINYLNILTAMFFFLLGVIFQAIAIPAKLPGLLLYVGGLISLISIVVYWVLGIITFSLQSLSLLRKSKRRNIQSLLLITMSAIGVFSVLFLWQGHLTHGGWIMVAALISSGILEWVELRSIKSRSNH
ncbi:MAG: hypothetical protein KME10_00540 [Plectolyngbya sp. WJT66-NPBG17]|jgi:uncharacterized membrane protein|nr:hypothetical protein [Plectolyngbya sp. WJT66-NPBG17]